MIESTTKRRAKPVEQEIDSEVLAFGRQFDDKSPLDELVREGARRIIQAAIDSEVEAFIERHSGRVDERGRRLIVKNGSLPAREILTGAGPVEINQGRVRDKSKDPGQRVDFSSSVLPAY